MMNAGSLHSLWLAEIDRFGFNERDFDAAACAELADELELYRVQALADHNFQETHYEWDCYLVEHTLWLALEQSCHDGVLLPMDQRVLRLKTCPAEMLSRMSWFLELCPVHVKHHLALMYYVVVRIDRARRTSSPEWRPETALAATENSTFFRPPTLTTRKYTG
jgi:hypothetical protein